MMSDWQKELRVSEGDGPKKIKLKRKKKRITNALRGNEVVKDILRTIGLDELMKKASMDDVKEVKQSIQKLETNVLESFKQMEANFQALKIFVEDSAAKTNARSNQLDEEMKKFAARVETANEKNKSKLVRALQKLQAQHIADIEHTRTDMTSISERCMHESQSNSERIGEVSRELSKLRDTVDNLVMRRYGHIPGTKSEIEGISTSFHCGVDAGIALDQVAQRIKAVETRLSEVEALDHIERSMAKTHLMSPVVESTQQDRGLHRLNNRMENVEDELEEIRRKVSQVSLQSKVKEEHRDNSNDIQLYDAAKLQTKIKSLSHNTSRACRSLSVGLSEVQHAILLLYSWADKVHCSFDTVCMKLNMPANICPRPQLKKSDTRDEERKFMDLAGQMFNKHDEDSA